MLKHPMLLVAQHTCCLHLLSQHADPLKLLGRLREETPKRGTLILAEGIPLVTCQPFEPVEGTHPLGGSFLQIVNGPLTSSASVQVMAIRAAVIGVVILPQSSCFQRESGEDL